MRGKSGGNQSSQQLPQISHTALKKKKIRQAASRIDRLPRTQAKTNGHPTQEAHGRLGQATKSWL
jgi:hypothetical protein